MICPRCREQLTQRIVDGEKIDFCSSCNGMWVHKDQLNRMISETDEDIESHSSVTEKDTDQYGPVVCRECKDVEMKKIKFHDYSDIIIDCCPSCGSFWLDKGELEKMHEHIKKEEEGSGPLSNPFVYNLLVKLSRISYSIFN